MSAPVFDVAIVGAGPVGLACAAVAKREQGRSLRVVVVDPRTGPSREPARAYAISGGSRRLFERLDAWEGLAKAAQPIVAMEIFDGLADDPVRVPHLRFEALGELGLAFVAFSDDVVDALEAVCSRLGVERKAGTVAGFEAGRATAAVSLINGDRVAARLVVAADGASSRLRALAGILSTEWDYGQEAIVATLSHEFEHDGRAEQHFLPNGPFAALPLKGRSTSIVWTETRAEARRLLNGPKEAFLAELSKRLPRRLGAFSLLDGPRAFALSFRAARRFAADRLALVGDAAHRVHPLAGQGLNLGLRDVASLAEVVIERTRLGLDPGTPTVLAAYERARRFDVMTSGLAMDGLNRLFSNRSGALRLARDLGLRLVDRAPLAKRRLIEEADGGGKSAPRLLQGLGL